MATTYLTRTPSSAGNLKKWTWSAWIKKSLSDGADLGVFGQYVDSNNYFRIRYRSNQRLQVDNYNSGSATFSVILAVEHRDPSGWYHLVVAYDSAQGTDSNRVKIYVNNVLQTVFQSTAYPSVNVDTKIPNTGSAIELGRTTQNQYFDGYMNNVAFVDGTALTPSSFGETDSTSGIWKFKSPSGVTFGTNGFHLKMDNSANLGLDSSGQTNNFTLSGNGRQAKDTPTNVRCTFNPLSAKVIGTVGFSLDNGATVLNPSSNTNQFAMGTLAASAGKWYWEMKSTSAAGGDWPDIGFMFADKVSTHMAATGNPQHNFSYAASIQANGTKWAFGTATSNWFGGFGNNAIIMCAVDVTAGKLWWGVDGAWLNSGNPASGTYAGATFAAGTSITPWTEQYSTGDIQANFGNGYFATTAITSAGSNGNGSLFEYDVPSGYYALNTKNINTYG